MSAAWLSFVAGLVSLANKLVVPFVYWYARLKGKQQVIEEVERLNTEKQLEYETIANRKSDNIIDDVDRMRNGTF